MTTEHSMLEPGHGFVNPQMPAFQHDSMEHAHHPDTTSIMLKP